MSTVFPRHPGWNSVPRLGRVLCQDQTPIRLTPYPIYDSAETMDSIRPLRPGEDDPVDNWGYLDFLHTMFYGMKDLLDSNSPLHRVVTRCFELLNEHLDEGYTRANYYDDCRNLYYDLLRLFLPVYNYKTLYDTEIEECCDMIYEIFQKWLYISRFDMYTSIPTNTGRPQNLETGASDMRNLLSRLKNT